MSTILLIHGAWHGSWCWANVQSILQLAGRNVVTVDLPGRAGDHSSVETLTLKRYADKVLRVAELQGEPVIAVGHSMAGAVISAAAEKRPELVRHLVYLSAYLPADGQSVFGIAQEDGSNRLLPYLRPDTPSEGWLWFAPDVPVRETLYADCEEEDARKAELLLTPEPALPLGTPAELTSERFGRVSKAYVECGQDQVIPIGLQRSMREAAGVDSLATLDTSHSPFLSAPREVADVLLRV